MSSRALVAVLPLFAFSCASAVTPSPAPPPRPNPPTPSVLNELASARSTAAPEPPPPLSSTAPPAGPVPVKIAGPLKTEAAKKAVLDIRPFCAPAVSHESGNETVGCACCPPFELCGPNPAAKLVEADQVFPLRGRVDGSFSGPSEHEAALVFDGCESHAENYGGTLLVDLTDPATGKPRAPDYRPGVHPQHCKSLRAPRGNDALLCEYVDGHQGNVTDQIFVYDFANKDTPFESIYMASDDTLAACTGAGSGIPVVAQHIDDFATRDTNGDGILDVTIHVLARRGKVTKPYTDACMKALNSDDAAAQKLPPLGNFLGARDARTLTFLGKKDGSFEATPETNASLKVMNAEHDAFFQQHD